MPTPEALCLRKLVVRFRLIGEIIVNSPINLTGADATAEMTNPFSLFLTR